jgi:hypothetical protein
VLSFGDRQDFASKFLSHINLLFNLRIEVVIDLDLAWINVPNKRDPLVERSSVTQRVIIRGSLLEIYA